jgi:NAD(P) transhydrogenase subunit alpha
VAVVFGAANVVGGYVVTDRMLQMFRRREPARTAEPAADAGESTARPPQG